MYSAFLQKFSFTHIAILLLLFILLGSCVFMIMNMEENFAPGKIFDDCSFLAKSLASLDKVGSIFYKTPSLRDSSHKDLLKRI